MKALAGTNGTDLMYVTKKALYCQEHFNTVKPTLMPQSLENRVGFGNANSNRLTRLFSELFVLLYMSEAEGHEFAETIIVHTTTS